MSISLNYALRANWTCRSGQCLESAAHQGRPKAPSTGSLRQQPARRRHGIDLHRQTSAVVATSRSAIGPKISSSCCTQQLSEKSCRNPIFFS